MNEGDPLYDVVTPDYPPVSPENARLFHPSGAPDVSVDTNAQMERVSNYVSASRRAQEVVDNTNADVFATRDQMDTRNKAIRDATGVDLQNPYTGGYRAEALDRLHADPALWAGADGAVDTSVQGTALRVQKVAADIYQEKANALQEQFPQHADIIRSGIPIEADAKVMQKDVARRLSEAGSGMDATSMGIASFLGRSIGMLRDPVNIGALLIGGGELRAVSTIGRVAENMITQGAINAGLTAIDAPIKQARYADLGLEHGFGDAMKDIAYSFAFGAGIGGLHAGARALLGRDPHGTFGQALDRVQDGTAPLPELPVASVHDQPALDVLPPGPVRDPVEAAATLREDPVHVSAALASDAPDLHATGRLASLSDEAFGDVAAGRADPRTAIAVAARVADEEQHAPILRDALRDNPRSDLEAAQAVTDALEHRNLRETQAAAFGHEPVDPPAGPERFDRAEADGQIASLRDEFGLAPLDDTDVVLRDLSHLPETLPVETPDGAMKWVPREEWDSAMRRKSVMADIVANCRM